MKTPTAQQVRRALKAVSTPERAKSSQWFFKTGPGQYGEGDVFIGVDIPTQRQIVREFQDLSLPEVVKLLHSKIHEERMTALLILVRQFERTKDQKMKEKIFNIYLGNTRWINNWDLVDVTAPRIVGAYLGERGIPTFRRLAKSKNLWEKRIAMISTLYQISRGDCKPAMAVTDIVLHDSHDLMHKATGWMLREVGKRCSAQVLEEFLEEHAATMPRTALRYAIEKFPKSKQQYYLRKKKN